MATDSETATSALWLRPIDFVHRARRTEAIHYAIGATLLGVLVQQLLPFVAEPETAGRVLNGYRIAAFVPVPALFVRRLRDQGRSPAWLAVLLGVVAADATRIAIRLSGFGIAPPAATLFDIGIGGGGLLLAAFWLWPGNPGANRYGADPRA